MQLEPIDFSVLNQLILGCSRQIEPRMRDLKNLRNSMRRLKGLLGPIGLIFARFGRTNFWSAQLLIELKYEKLTIIFVRSIKKVRLLKDTELERELKLKEIIANTATTILALYVVTFGFLGKSLFVLTVVGFWLVFVPVWFLAASAILSATSIAHNTHIPMNLVLTIYSIGVIMIPVTLSLVYSQPALFWG